MTALSPQPCQPPAPPRRRKRKKRPQGGWGAQGPLLPEPRDGDTQGGTGDTARGQWGHQRPPAQCPQFPPTTRHSHSLYPPPVSPSVVSPPPNVPPRGHCHPLGVTVTPLVSPYLCVCVPRFVFTPPKPCTRPPNKPPQRPSQSWGRLGTFGGGPRDILGVSPARRGPALSQCFIVAAAPRVDLGGIPPFPTPPQSEEGVRGAQFGGAVGRAEPPLPNLQQLQTFHLN